MYTKKICQSRLTCACRLTGPWQVRTLVQQELASALEQYDVLVGPCAPTTAYPIGGVVKDPLAMYKGDLMTVNVNLAGLLLLSNKQRD